jgi:hypothetical protein
MQDQINVRQKQEKDSTSKYSADPDVHLSRTNLKMLTPC